MIELTQDSIVTIDIEKLIASLEDFPADITFNISDNELELSQRKDSRKVIVHVNEENMFDLIKGLDLKDNPYSITIKVSHENETIAIERDVVALLEPTITLTVLLKYQGQYYLQVIPSIELISKDTINLDELFLGDGEYDPLSANDYAKDVVLDYFLEQGVEVEGELDIELTDFTENYEPKIRMDETNLTLDSLVEHGIATIP